MCVKEKKVDAPTESSQREELGVSLAIRQARGRGSRTDRRKIGGWEKFGPPSGGWIKVGGGG